MLTALALLIAMLLAGDFSWLSADTSHVVAPRAPRPIITPEEPFTLTLGLIGLGTMVVYFALSRTVFRRRVERPLESHPDVDAGVSNEQTRGAA